MCCGRRGSLQREGKQANQTRAGMGENVAHSHSQEGPYSIDSHIILKNTDQKFHSLSCVFSTSPPKPSLNSYRRDFSFVCNQVAHQQSSGAIVNFSLSFCLSAESCQTPVYHHPFKCSSAQNHWTSILTLFLEHSVFLPAAVIKPCYQIASPFLQTSQFHFP